MPPTAVALVRAPAEVVAVGVAPAVAAAVTVVPAVAEVSSVGVVAEAAAAPVAEDHACIAPPWLDTPALARVPTPALVAEPPADWDVCAPPPLVVEDEPPELPEPDLPGLATLEDRPEPCPTPA